MLAIAPVSVIAKEKVPEPVELSESELDALQNREVSAETDVVFRSTIAALQEIGYININASKDAGTITAETDAKSKLVYNIFWGFGKKKRTQLASVFVEPMGSGRTRMSIKMQMVEAKARMGASYSDGKPIRFAEPYASFYAEFDKALALRAGDGRDSAPEANATPVVSETQSADEAVEAEAVAEPAS